MGILDGIVEWIAEQIMYGLDLINTSVLGALGCDMNTFLRYFPAAETMYSLLVALAIGLILLGWVWNLFKNYGLGLGVDAEDPVKLTAKAGSAGRLFGSVTTKEVAEGLKAQFQVEVDKRKISMADVKAFGSYEAEVKLYPGISAKITVMVGEG